MANLLFVTSSLMGDAARSTQVAAEYVAAWRAATGGTVVERALTPAMPHLPGETLAALMTPQDKRTADQQGLVTAADHFIAEVEAADTLVIAAPMYNFSIPSTLKAWIDHIARAGRTFRYTANGPVGLLTGKKAVIVVSRGGYYTAGAAAAPMDHQEPYLRTVLGFLGITDVTFIAVEGQAVSKEAAETGLAAAYAALRRITPRRAA